MNTTPICKRFVTGAVGAAIAGVATPALLFLGAGTAQAAQDVTTIQRPGHVSIKAEPPRVSPPRVWGPFTSPLPILGD